MHFRLFQIMVFILCFQGLSFAQIANKDRVFVLTDISNEPDDEESLVRFLVYSNEYEVEGLVATTSTWLRTNPREDLIRRQLFAYGLVRDNLQKHLAGFPSKDDLLLKVATGQPTFGMDAVGEGKSTPGSRLLQSAIDREDDRPLWVSVWGGANTLAQTLWDVRNERTEEELQQFVSKIRVYSISDQDDAGPWMRKEFPTLFYIVSPSVPDWKEYYRATWTGISGDRHYKNGPGYAFELVDNPWLNENIISHGPLGNLYPPLAYIMEGDTPAFLGLIRNGLGWSISPAYGGWGGRYTLFQAYGETRPIWTDSQETIDCIELDDRTYCSNQATIWRWRRDFQYDFAARMDWCITPDYANANHHPSAVLNGDLSREILRIPARTNEIIKLSAAGSQDPDGDRLNFQWMIYPEASTPGTRARLEHESTPAAVLTIEDDSAAGELHIILKVYDDATPYLVSYRRAVIEISK